MPHTGYQETPTNLHTIRARNREARQRDELIHNVMARLEVYAALCPRWPAQGEAVLRDHATRLVEAVLALAKERP